MFNKKPLAQIIGNNLVPTMPRLMLNRFIKKEEFNVAIRLWQQKQLVDKNDKPI